MNAAAHIIILPSVPANTASSQLNEGEDSRCQASLECRRLRYSRGAAAGGAVSQGVRAPLGWEGPAGR
eukprot:COSAG04_NODE_14205_length_577_cov_0.780335_2_plen_67_part_01